MNKNETRSKLVGLIDSLMSNKETLKPEEKTALDQEIIKTLRQYKRAKG